jgi:lipase chaperone LimK
LAPLPVMAAGSSLNHSKPTVGFRNEKMTTTRRAFFEYFLIICLGNELH